MLKARSVWYIATIGLDESIYSFPEQAPWTREPFVQRVLHPSVRTLLDDPAYRERALAAPATAKARAAVANNKENLKTLLDAGVRIGFGSDSGVGMRYAGVAEHRELALSVEAGLTPLQALTLATSNAAALLKLEDRGVLAVGKLANLVVLDGDPTVDMSNSKKITLSGIAANRQRDRSRCSHPKLRFTSTSNCFMTQTFFAIASSASCLLHWRSPVLARNATCQCTAPMSGD